MDYTSLTWEPGTECLFWKIMLNIRVFIDPSVEMAPVFLGYIWFSPSPDLNPIRTLKALDNNKQKCNFSGSTGIERETNM